MCIFKLFRKKQSTSNKVLWNLYLDWLYSTPTQLDRIEVKLDIIEKKIDKLPHVTEQEEN